MSWLTELLDLQEEFASTVALAASSYACEAWALTRRVWGLA